jgi:hypothetical protein
MKSEIEQMQFKIGQANRFKVKRVEKLSVRQLNFYIKSERSRIKKDIIFDVPAPEIPD